MLLLTLRGTPTCYYGEEIGMQDVPVPLEQMSDPQGKENPQHSRDPQRTPMQWNASANAGFCRPEVRPWLPLSDDYQRFNVASEQQDPRSMLMLTRALLQQRRTLAALTIGAYRSVEQDNPACFVYERQYDDQRCLVALNFSEHEEVVKLPEYSSGSILLSTYMDEGEGTLDVAELRLRSNEGVLLEMRSL
jgi:alpha-glucosidase